MYKGNSPPDDSRGVDVSLFNVCRELLDSASECEEKPSS